MGYNVKCFSFSKFMVNVVESLLLACIIPSLETEGSQTQIQH